jgi:putative ABC transport system substrate-binding protein
MRRREFIAALGGAALAWPTTARAQRPQRMPRIGILWHAADAKEEEPYYSALLDGFRAIGYVDGRNATFLHRFPNEMPERFKSMAAELVSLKADVLVSSGANASIYAKNATSTIPLVFMFVPDPVAMKMVESLARPGGNVTGLSTYASDLIARRLQLLKEITPGLSRLAQLVNPNAKIAPMNIRETAAAAAKLGLTVQTFEARSLNELEPAFNAIAAAGLQAVTVNAGEGIQFQGRTIIPKLAIERRIAMCAISRETFEFGALMSYGVDQLAICRRAAVYVDKILKGAKPSEFPVEGPTKFEFLINLKTAKAIGIEVPPIMLSRADEVVE